MEAGGQGPFEFFELGSGIHYLDPRDNIYRHALLDLGQVAERLRTVCNSREKAGKFCRMNGSKAAVDDGGFFHFRWLGWSTSGKLYRRVLVRE